MLRAYVLVSLLVVTLAAPGCNEGFFEEGGGDGGAGDGGGCSSGQTRCMSNALQQCEGNKWVTQVQCTGNQVCSTSLGKCSSCDPNQNICKGNNLHKCDAGGVIGALIKSCGSYTCVAGACSDPCSKAESSRSYVGCHYWPTITANSSLSNDFSFAVVVANTYSKPAQVTISSASNANLSTTTVGGNSLVTIKLPWVAELKTLRNLTAGEKSTLKAGGAYHLKSTLPVTVYQFNPLHYVRNGDCKTGSDPNPNDGKCYSYTNDASLLLPEHALATEYMVIARPTMGFYKGTASLTSPGFFAVTAPKAGKTKVTVTFTANTQAGTGGVTAYSKGQTVSFNLSKYSVLQVLSQIPKSCAKVKSDKNGFDYCDLSGNTDLTGTIIKSDKEVAVFSGHNCIFVPFDKWACDHLEEQIFPTKSWGKKYAAAHTISSGKDPNIYRVVAADDNTKIQFKPAVRGAVQLNKGKWVEFTTTQDFVAEGTGRFALVQYMVGQNYSNLTPGLGAPGDPAMALAVPVEQYRTSYRFLAPANYQQNYINVLTQSSSPNITLDGKAIAASNFKAIGSSGYRAAKIKITGGSHYMQSPTKFGLAVYGVGSYTSYMYPGGLDLKLIY